MKAISLIKRTGIRPAAVLLALAMLAVSTIIPGAGFVPKADAASFSDISKHWAQSDILKAAEKGIVSGYSDGTFKPDRAVTRAEFTTMLNKALGNNGTTDSVFSDVANGVWYFDQVCKGVSAGYISGYADGTFKPSNTITRLEASVMLARIVPTYGYADDISKYKDGSSVPNWAQDSMKRIVGKGYLSTYGDNMLHGTDSLTRAQAVRVIMSMLDKEKIISNNQTVVQNNVTLKSMIFVNRISVGTAVGDGKVTLNDCMVLGTLNVEGGGKSPNGVIINDSRIANCLVNRSNQEVRVIAQGDSTVLRLTVGQIARLESYNLTGGSSFGKGFQTVNMTRAADLTVSCDLDLLEIEAEKCDITIAKGTTQRLITYNSARKLDVNVAANATLNTADIYSAGTAFSGTGTVGTMTVHGNGLTYEKAPGTLSVDPEVTVLPVQVG